jgi:hypothetical protein
MFIRSFNPEEKLKFIFNEKRKAGQEKSTTMWW